MESFACWGAGGSDRSAGPEAFPPRRTIDFSTVQFLAVWKRKVTSRHGWTGGSCLFFPHQAATVIRETVDDFVDRLFGADTLPLVRHLIEERGLATRTCGNSASYWSG